VEQKAVFTTAFCRFRTFGSLCAKTLFMNSLMLGDNLEMLKRVDSESVDLIYLDPPFFSNRNYEVIWGDAGEIRSFQGSMARRHPALH
jgi:DNA modification methylase